VLRWLKVSSATLLYATILVSVAIVESIICDPTLCHNTRQCCDRWKYYLRPYSMPQYSSVLRLLKVLSATLLYATILVSVAVVESIICNPTLCHNTCECCGRPKYYLRSYSMPQYLWVLRSSKVLSVTILYATILASVTGEKYYLRPYSTPQYSPVESIICDHTLCHNMPGCYRSKVLSATIIYARRLVRILQNPMLVWPKMLHTVAHGCQVVGNGHWEWPLETRKAPINSICLFFDRMPPMPMGDGWWGGELGLPIGQERSKTFISPAPLIFVVSLSTPVVSSHRLFQLSFLCLFNSWQIALQMPFPVLSSKSSSTNCSIKPISLPKDPWRCYKVHGSHSVCQLDMEQFYE
jgi:hypothetical protein